MEFFKKLRLYFMGHLPYNKKLKQYSRNHRNDSTLAEVLLWLELRAGSLRGYKFNRQKPIGNFIADFYCKKLNLVIEVDGITHINGDQDERDKIKDAYFRSIGLTLIRVDDEDVRRQISFVLEQIENYIDDFENRL